MNILKKNPMLFMGIGITILFLGIGLLRIDFLDTLELKLYNVLVGLRGDPGSQSDIVIVDIDDDSIEKIGRWPWPRYILAEGIKKINSGDPKVIGLNLILSEPEESTGLKTVKELEALFTAIFSDKSGEKRAAYLQALQNTMEKLDNDKKLAEAIKESGKVVLPVFFRESITAGGETKKADAHLTGYSIQNIRSPADAVYYRADEMILPIPSFIEASIGIGHINFGNDMDGIARRERLV
ncbi:MAG: CHASE2 domain-containing protein, partial [Desulfobacterales bacterium]|nr:CHASE2 domain-containing protein [Desulfobacterales bacterium]